MSIKNDIRFVCENLRDSIVAVDSFTDEEQTVFFRDGADNFSDEWRVISDE